jgi:hypothetical protein
MRADQRRHEDGEKALPVHAVEDRADSDAPASGESLVVAYATLESQAHG